jgi:two-component sensor histidine kinase
MWVEDFGGVAARFRALAADGVPDVARWLRKRPEEARVLAKEVRILSANRAAAELFELADPEELCGDLEVGFGEESYGPFLEELVRIARGQRRFSIDILGVTPSGKKRYLRMHWTAAPGHEEDLRFVYLSAVDLTELVQTEGVLRNAVKAKDYLLREIQHRVRNTLALINSLLDMQADAFPAAGAALADSARRVESLAIVHDSLYKRADYSLAGLRDCVDGVARQVFDALGEVSRDELELEVDDAELRVERAAPLALIVGELVANAVEHGRSEAGARVKLVAESGERGALSLVVEDSGPGLDWPAASASARGLGLALVEALAAQLGGTLQSESGSGGVGCRIRLEIPPDEI